MSQSVELKLIPFSGQLPAIVSRFLCHTLTATYQSKKHNKYLGHCTVSQTSSTHSVWRLSQHGLMKIIQLLIWGSFTNLCDKTASIKPKIQKLSVAWKQKPRKTSTSWLEKYEFFKSGWQGMTLHLLLADRTLRKN